VCRDILGLISDKDIVIADNAFNTPQDIGSVTVNVDDTKDIYIHGVMLALGTSFRVQNYNSGPTNVNDCKVSSNGRGCIYLSGGLIQQARGAVGTSSGSGFARRYAYDHCAVVTRRPIFRQPDVSRITGTSSWIRRASTTRTTSSRSPRIRDLLRGSTVG
jgi:hypothetical protein